MVDEKKINYSHSYFFLKVKQSLSHVKYIGSTILMICIINKYKYLLNKLNKYLLIALDIDIFTYRYMVL